MGKKDGGLVFQQFIKKNKSNKKVQDEFNKTSFSESVNEAKFDKRSLLKMILNHDDAMITTNRGKEYIIYNPKSNNKQNADMWKGNNSVFAVDRGGEEHEIKFSDITNFKA